MKKKLIYLFLVLMIFVYVVTTVKSIKTQTYEPSVSWKLGDFNTLLSPDNELNIVRYPKVRDFSFILTELPRYNPDSDEIWQVDLRSGDLSKLNLKNRFDDLIYSSFDNNTQWPAELPEEFNPYEIMELGKNPGLGLRELHKKGITGKGVGIAIIDQTLLVDHKEYIEQLKMYEEIHCGDEIASMHGAAVASIAVGKSVGVAPEADLYYIAESHSTMNDQGVLDWDLSWLAKSIGRIIEINKKLPTEGKIRVISISLGIMGKRDGYEKVLDSIEKAKQEGIYTIYVGSELFLGLGRDPLKSADISTSFSKGCYWSNSEYRGQLLIPMDSRTTASPTGNNDYVFYRFGGASWTVPYVAGLYALACNVNPDITPDVFWEEAFNTCDTVFINDRNHNEFVKIVNPVMLMEKLKK